MNTVSKIHKAHVNVTGRDGMSEMDLGLFGKFSIRKWDKTMSNDGY